MEKTSSTMERATITDPHVWMSLFIVKNAERFGLKLTFTSHGNDRFNRTVYFYLQNYISCSYFS